MKTLFELFRRFDARCIFGSIRRLGGMSRPKVKCYDLLSTRALQVEGDTPLGLIQRICFIFLSTPSGWRVTHKPLGVKHVTVISIHALRVEGDLSHSMFPITAETISIHALRVEGDSLLFFPGAQRHYFYPRPPGGGRPKGVKHNWFCPEYFYPRPPGGGRLNSKFTLSLK